MEGQNSIHDYDVVVSYNENELNNFLLQRAAEVGTPTSEGLKWVEHTKGTVPPTPIHDFDEEYTNTLEVAFGSPSLQILDREGNITFSAPMTGSKTVVRDSDGREKITKFANVKVVITASLSTVSGTTNAAGKFTPDPSPDPSRANEVRIIESGNDTALGVCIDFPSLLAVDFYNDGQGGNSPDDLDQLTSLVKAKIERRFKDSGFQYCLAGLNNEKPQDPAGMKFTLNLPSHEIKADGYDNTTTMGVSSHLDGFHFNLNSPKTKLDIAAANSTSTPPIKVSYASGTLNMGWSHSTPGREGHHEYGSVDLDFTFTGTATWTRGPNPEQHPNQLGMSFSFASVLGVKVNPKNHTIWERMCGASDALPPHAKDIHPEAPKISIDMSPMDFFLTTNLLFPGEHIFHMDDPGQTTELQGLMTPRDTILTGTIKRVAV
ncbi:uncharacterized protein C8A04DRAFT_14673 [Dichotomopilus funicola]|uniref:Uncharacterized protein n=1 Tax=Dichotomopilus funicola TaxID=1934379 RepID=A0AAN6UX01_9PEZI|nr:hypothetical protein C8A04DRAFT_14673 [Dichotomopilus funicola]